MISEDEALAAYASVEAAYRQQQWQEVLSRSQLLRDALDPAEDRLRPRLLLLEGHALLHGCADPLGAEERYRRVLRTDDASLRPWAEEALAGLSGSPPVQEIAEPVHPVFAAAAEPTGEALGADPFPFTAAATGVAPQDMATAAMPWLEPSPEPSPRPAVADVAVVRDPLPLISGQQAPEEYVIELEPVPAVEPDPAASAELAEGLLRVRLH